MYRYRQLRLDQKYRQDPNDCNKNRKQTNKNKVININKYGRVDKQTKKKNQSIKQIE